MVLNEGYVFPVTQPSGGDGDSNIFIVRFVANAGGYTCDKTFWEIIEAVNDGKTIIGNVNGLTLPGYFDNDIVTSAANVLTFYRIHPYVNVENVPGTITGLYVEALTINDENEVSNYEFEKIFE